ncbi:hypothetical protein [Phenylobacterium sp.]|uniref:hypothetical protein n=1 Tax=Phenylobacterium sp. TaxID=1871053 RepID=UPI002732CA48|nr:hypothetical protein [Phenylobacterium sp.]MDP3855207.1 hypothetical protein [Phenylobacterium sp.]
MDRRRRRTRALGGLAAALIAAGAVPAADVPLAAMRWLSLGAEPVALLTLEPAECLAMPVDPGLTRSVEIGRAAFRTPLLLGGQAARAGISCESCHRAGRANPAFRFPGVSGPPGTADVTSSLFSSHRGNGVDDPRPIPDLSGPRAGLKVAPGDVAPFVRGLIVEEFDGPEPSPAVLQGLADYVRALGPQACPTTSARAITVQALMSDARRAIAAAQSVEDPRTAAFLVTAARARLFLLDERYARLRPERAALRRADRDLAHIAQALREGRPEARAQLARWQARTPVLEARLRRAERGSLLDSKTLAAVL